MKFFLQLSKHLALVSLVNSQTFFFVPFFLLLQFIWFIFPSSDSFLIWNYKYCCQSGNVLVDCLWKQETLSSVGKRAYWWLMKERNIVVSRETGLSMAYKSKKHCLQLGNVPVDDLWKKETLSSVGKRVCRWLIKARNIVFSRETYLSMAYKNKKHCLQSGNVPVDGLWKQETLSSVGKRTCRWLMKTRNIVFSRETYLSMAYENKKHCLQSGNVPVDGLWKQETLSSVGKRTCRWLMKTRNIVFSQEKGQSIVYVKQN